MTRYGPDPPIGPYRRVPVQVHEADPDAPEVARRLIALIATRWPATPAEHVGSSAVPDLAAKNIIDLLMAVGSMCMWSRPPARRPKPCAAFAMPCGPIRACGAVTPP